MFSLITAALLIFGYAVAQDPDCDYSQNVGATERYYITSPGYPSYYSAGRTCRYIMTCPVGYNCRLDCSLDMPTTPNCSGDRFLISRNGDPTLAGATAYCGVQSLTAVSNQRTMSVGLITSSTSRGGRYTCNLTAQVASVPPTPACRCGERKTTRIVGGQVTKVNEYPMMVGLIEVSTDQIHCGGVIISNRYVMTAAHCVYNYNRPTDLIVLAGTHNIEQDRTGAYYYIDRFTIHPQFNINTYDYDIALVVTQAVIQFTETIQPVCLPFKYSSNSNLSDAIVTILGWGTTSFGGPISNPLRKVDVSVITQQRCRSLTTNVSDRQFCTLTPGKDACQMDSGGPVLYTDPATGLLMSFGVVSSGDGCGTQRPGIQTNVITLLTWVVNNANSNFCIIR